MKQRGLWSISILCAAAPVYAQFHGTAPSPGARPPFASMSLLAGDGFLGVLVRDVDGPLAEELGLPEERGALLVEIVADLPANQAGLEANDVVIGWNGTRVESARQFSRMVKETPPGRTVHLQVIRNREPITLDATIGEHGDRGMGRTFGWHPDIDADGNPLALPIPPTAPLEPFARMPHGMAAFDKPRLGIGMAPLTDQLAEFFGLEGDTGVLISSVMEDSAAAEANLRAGDVIISIDGEDVSSMGDVQRAVMRADGLTDFTIIRDKQQRTVEVDFQATGAGEARTPADSDSTIEQEHATEPIRYPRSSM